MIYLLHGDNLLASRNFLLKLKKDYPEVKNLNVKNLSELRELASFNSLFAPKELIIIEGYKEDLLEKIKEIGSKSDIAVWVDKKIKNIPPYVKALEFKETYKGNVFKLADFVAEKNLARALLLLEELASEKTPFEIIVATLVRQFNFLLIYLDEKTFAGPDFAKEKIKKYSQNWQLEEVMGALKNLLILDQKLKIGKVESKIGLTQFLLKIIK